MMNRIGIRDEDRIGARDPSVEDRTTVIWVLEHGGAGPGGTRVRRSGWPGWRSATGGSCGPRAPAGSGWTSPSAAAGRTPSAARAGPGSTSGPGSARPPGRAPPDLQTARVAGPVERPIGARTDGRRFGRITLGRRSGRTPRRPAGSGVTGTAVAARGGELRRRGRACISCRSRRGRVGCGRPSCRLGVGVGGRRVLRLR
jgi:hypothetical protein